ncbi:vacuolar protein sorting-associated protein 62-like [Penaeus monodon]|uniref:vacuolar protein sorting-associated protein 62-like n=1 Tax=Penaeus monodon TaxID=6687 RepID=UPI0018A7CABD|nr:vacuolar protein sorting-associated protein 62-like [Penaeus monodon]
MAATLLLLTLLTATTGVLGSPVKPVPRELLDIIIDWAPLIWLHPEEVFFPSSVEFHFENVEVRTANETVVQTSPDRWSVVTGPETSSMHLNSVPDLDCADCLLDWFAGQNVSEVTVPTYVFIKDYHDACGTVDVAYRSFYPYNFGKDVCVGVPVGDVCEGYMQSFGNHVGDWEHFSIRIRNKKVVECYIAVHSFGAWYSWNETANNFQFTHGEDSRIDVIDVTYPVTVEVVEGRHAEVFSANGSHGLWSEAGTHEYVHFPIHLKDQTDRGYAWRTWDSLEIVEYDPDVIYEGELHYLDFRGRWGNQKRGCEVEVVSGECILVGGPGYWPQGPGDFPEDDCGA